MTVSALELCQSSTKSIASHHKFYPANIAVRHHQLRHFISTAEENRIYYANDYDIYVLDLATQQTTLLATVPFETRCLAADLGWVCVGGEQNGDCAFIRLDQEQDTPKCFGHDLNVEVLEGDIVNSMNIHLLRDELGVADEPVVLISNNDRTVKIYSLAQREVLTVLIHDTPMNYAALSPDSNIIAAVGDSDLVHFYKRRRVERSTKTVNDGPKYPEYDWLPLTTPVVPTGDSVHDDYSFAVSFSPSGHLCAASSQGGAISVFDMKLLQEEGAVPENAILCTFRSSRPTVWGCVRAMAFSPEPWDMIAWAEDHGRVGIVDVRRMFLRRQSLQLDKDATEVVTVRDETPSAYRGLGVKEKLKQQHLARLRSMRGLPSRDPSAELPAEENVAEGAERHRSRTDLLSNPISSDLSARERSVLEALDTTIDDVEHTNPHSLNYISSPRYRPSSSATDPATDEDHRAQNTEIRPGSRAHQPRRRTSVILSEPSSTRHLAPIEGPRTRISASPGRMTDDDDVPIMSTNDLTPTARGSTQHLPYSIPPSDPWHVIQSALAMARQADGNAGSSVERPATLAQIEAALEAERRLGNQLERQLTDERQLSNRLRRELEMQERLLQSQQRDLREERDSGTGLEPSLQNEQQFGEQRSQELETEILLGNSRARRLESERARLMIEASRLGSDQSSETSAHTTTLPTANLRQTNQSERFSAALQRHEELRQQRLALADSLNFERQGRRAAEIRLARASSELPGRNGAVQRGTDSNRFRSYQMQGTARAAADSGESSGNAVADALQRASVRRAEMAMNSDRVGSTRPSELSGRATEAEMRLARTMFMTGSRALDNNGNWVPGSALQLALGRAAAGGDDESSLNDMIREVGVGTTGIGWSPDGRSLYAGSEQGIFEFKINMRDRMTFPGIEMR